MNTSPISLPAGQDIALPDLSLIAISGADAASFLQGQLSNDINAITPAQAQLTSYSTAKGRLLATLLIWADAQAPEPRYLALVKSDIADALVKRLSMFVLRAKVIVSKVDLPVFGRLAQDAQTEVQLGISRQDGVTRIQAPSHSPSTGRWWCVGSDVVPESPTPDASGLSHWQSLDIQAGLPWITQAIQDLFIPQTLNLDLIGAISFTKGCYPGQEVVARSHYRGTIKRRMACGLIKAVQQLPQAGSDIFDANQPDNPCGRVINAAHDAQDDLYALLEVQLADLASADFRLGQADGPQISIQPLPYDIHQARS